MNRIFSSFVIFFSEFVLGYANIPLHKICKQTTTEIKVPLQESDGASIYIRTRFTHNSVTSNVLFCLLILGLNEYTRLGSSLGRFSIYFCELVWVFCKMSPALQQFFHLIPHS